MFYLLDIPVKRVYELEQGDIFYWYGCLYKVASITRRELKCFALVEARNKFYGNPLNLGRRSKQLVRIYLDENKSIQNRLLPTN